MAKYEIKDGVGIIPEGTTRIERDAFSGSENLRSVVIPDSVTEIDNWAFKECTSLTGIVIPCSVQRIGTSAFSGCSELIEVTISEGVTTIGDSAFSECCGLSTIIIPSTVTEIGESAFKGCSGLTDIAIPESVITIGDGAFTDCTGLKSIIIPKSVKQMGTYIFQGCNGLERASILAPTIIKYHAFADCSALENVTLGVGIKKIDKDAFSDCSALKTINVPAKKGDYYCQRLPVSMQSYVVEAGQTSTQKPVAKQETASAKKVYKVIFNCDCYEGVCAKFVDNATPFDELGYRIDFEQKDGKLEEKTKKILLTSALYGMMVVEDATGKILKVDQYPGQIAESWVEKKLALEPGNRYYIQGMQEHYGGTFTKRITFKIETENEFDISKLVKICDSKFDDLYWKIQKDEVEGLIIHDIEPDEGLMNPYELYYDGKIVKASKVSTPDSLRGEAYMCFEWPADNK